MKIYVILIALLPLAAIGLDMHLNETNISFLRSVASGDLDEDAAAPDAGAETAAATPSLDETSVDQSSGGSDQLAADGDTAPAVESPAETGVASGSIADETPPADDTAASPGPEEGVVAEADDGTAPTPPEASLDPAEASGAPESNATAQIAALPDSTASASEATTGEVDPNLVWLVQDRLNRLGYVGSEPLIPDGRLNANTKLAIRAFQIHQGLQSDGRPSAALLEHLETSLEQSLYSTSPSFVEQSPAADAPSQSGDATATASLSATDSPATGTPTEAGPEVGAPLVSDAGPAATPSGTAASGAQASQTAALPPAGETTEDADTNDPIADSADSSLVFLIQDRLNRLGYSGDRPLSPDGRLGPRTRAIITTYQEDKGLPPTGAPTEALLNHMEATLTGRKPQSSLPAVVDDSPTSAPAAETEAEAGMAVTGLAVAPQSETAAQANTSQTGASGVSGYVSFRKGLAATREGAVEAAIVHYSQAIDSRDWLEKHLAFSRRGDAYSDQGNLDAALADYSAAIRLKPDYTDAMIRRALVYEAKEMTDHAISDYRRVTELDPSEGRAAERLERLGISVQ